MVNNPTKKQPGTKQSDEKKPKGQSSTTLKRDSRGTSVVKKSRQVEMTGTGPGKDSK